jgi:L-lactate utilization protein LutC
MTTGIGVFGSDFTELRGAGDSGGYMLKCGEAAVRLLEKLVENRDSHPACVTIITGPSASAGIVGVRTLGVHGPGEVHVWITQDE